VTLVDLNSQMWRQDLGRPGRRDAGRSSAAVSAVVKVIKLSLLVTDGAIHSARLCPGQVFFWPALYQRARPKKNCRRQSILFSVSDVKRDFYNIDTWRFWVFRGTRASVASTPSWCCSCPPSCPASSPCRLSSSRLKCRSCRCECDRGWTCPSWARGRSCWGREAPSTTCRCSWEARSWPEWVRRVPSCRTSWGCCWRPTIRSRLRNRRKSASCEGRQGPDSKTWECPLLSSCRSPAFCWSSGAAETVCRRVNCGRQTTGGGGSFVTPFYCP